MKKITKLFMLVGLALTGQSQAQIFFSEYAEGTAGNNKYIEIANGGSSDVSLDDYMLVNNVNGGTTGQKYENDNSLMIKGITLKPGQVYVIANSSADKPVLDKADTTFSGINFNGDDYWAILSASDTNIIDEVTQVLIPALVGMLPVLLLAPRIKL